MKKCSFLILGIIIWSMSAVAAESELVVYYFERMPYYGVENNEPKGIIVEISKMIFDEAGINYRFEEVPSRRIQENLKKSGNMASLGWLKTKEREADYTFTNDYIYQDEPYCALVSTSKLSLFGNKIKIEDILTNKLTLGVVDGFVYGEWLDGNISKYKPKKEQVNIGDDAERMYKMLASSRFDYMFAGFEESSYVLSKNIDYKKYISIVSITDAPFGNKRYIMFNKDIDKNILKKINEAVVKIKQDEQYKKIIAKLRNGMY